MWKGFSFLKTVAWANNVETANKGGLVYVAVNVMAAAPTSQYLCLLSKC